MDLNALLGMFSGQNGQGGNSMMGQTGAGMPQGGMGGQGLQALLPLILAHLAAKQKEGGTMVRPEMQQRGAEMLNPVSGNMPNMNASDNTNFPTTGAARMSYDPTSATRHGERNMGIEALLSMLSGRR